MNAGSLSPELVAPTSRRNACSACQLVRHLARWRARAISASLAATPTFIMLPLDFTVMNSTSAKKEHILARVKDKAIKCFVHTKPLATAYFYLLFTIHPEKANSEEEEEEEVGLCPSQMVVREGHCCTLHIA